MGIRAEIRGAKRFEKTISRTLGVPLENITMQNRATVAVELLRDKSSDEISALTDLMLIAAREYTSGLKDVLAFESGPLNQRFLEVFNIISPIIEKIPSRLKKMPGQIMM